MQNGEVEGEEDILSMMLKYEAKNPDYQMEELDDFLTFFVAGDLHLLQCLWLVVLLLLFRSNEIVMRIIEPEAPI